MCRAGGTDCYFFRRERFMTWEEYYELEISRGGTPDLIMNTIGHLMDLYESYDWDAEIPFKPD